MTQAINENTIKALEKIGFKRWTKKTDNGKVIDRMYINAKQLGLKCDYYKTGNIHYAELDGEWISNTRARNYIASKTYIDIETGEAHSTVDVFQEKVERILAESITE